MQKNVVVQIGGLPRPSETGGIAEQKTFATLLGFSTLLGGIPHPYPDNVMKTLAWYKQQVNDLCSKTLGLRGAVILINCLIG